MRSFQIQCSDHVIPRVILRVSDISVTFKDIIIISKCKANIDEVMVYLNLKCPLFCKKHLGGF